MTRSNNNCRTAMVAPAASNSIREAHSYEYDNNGNIVYVNTSRVKPDMTAQPDTVQRAREEKFRWDEENRLTALSQNGYLSNYWYDADGNLTGDRNKGIHAIVYNVLDLPSRVEFNDGHIIRYRYAADGRKLRTDYVLSNYTVIDNPGGPSILHSGGAQPMGGGTFTPGGDGLPDPENQLETTLMVRDYCGNHIYRDGVLERITNDYGYWAGGNWYYHVKDYQGNVRAVIDGQGALEEVNNYYPYGALMGGGTLGGNAGVQPYKYGTKELDRQNGLDWYDSQARMYDPLLGRTPTLDPKAEKYYSISPYAWCGGNPINKIDQNGDSIALLHYEGHSALLIQATHEDGTKWHYYSFNGTFFFNNSGGSSGGSSYNNTGLHAYNSIEEFLHSDYNAKGSGDDVIAGRTNGYGYDKALVLPSNSTQDEQARTAFVQIVNKGYNLATNNCVTASREGLKAAGIEVNSMSNSFLPNGSIVERREEPITPSSLYYNVITKNKNVKEIMR